MDRRTYSRQQQGPSSGQTSTGAASNAGDSRSQRNRTSQLNLQPINSGPYSPKVTLPPFTIPNRYDSNGPYQSSPLHAQPHGPHPHRQFHPQQPVHHSHSDFVNSGHGNPDAPWPARRTSSSRDEVPSHAGGIQSSRLGPFQPREPSQTIKREKESLPPHLMPTIMRSPSTSSQPLAPLANSPTYVLSNSGNSKDEEEDSMPATSDFVKKLFKMLEEPSYQKIVCWGPQGDIFVVKDMAEFTKHVLPKMFKHSNFASFVRQLNKYDFHKVKKTDESYGEHSWIFRHPDFRADRIEALELIKRKIPPARKSSNSQSVNLASNVSSSSQMSNMGHGMHSSNSSISSPSASGINVPALLADFQASMNVLQNEVTLLRSRCVALEERAEVAEGRQRDVLTELAQISKNCAKQDHLQHQLIAYHMESDRKRAGLTDSHTPPNGSSGVGSSKSASPITQSTVSVDTFQQSDGITTQVYSTHGYLDMNQMMHMSSQGSISAAPVQVSNLPARSRAGSITSVNTPVVDPGNVPFVMRDNGSGWSTGPSQLTIAPNETLNTQAVFGNAAPAEVAVGNPRASWHYPEATVADIALETSEAANQRLNAADLTDTVPASRPPLTSDDGVIGNTGSGLAVPQQMSEALGMALLSGKRVLVVDDDAVSRAINSKILRRYGLTSEVAVDGIAAVKRMEAEKFDIVFMDIVMPNADGIKATTMIRRFDISTPIISMTSDIREHDMGRYADSGMNDILPKPFNQYAVLNILEKFLISPSHISENMQTRSQLSNALTPSSSIMMDPSQSIRAQGIPFDPASLGQLSPGMCRMIESITSLPMPTELDLDIGMGMSMLSDLASNGMNAVLDAGTASQQKRERETEDIGGNGIDKRARFEEVVD